MGWFKNPFDRGDEPEPEAEALPEPPSAAQIVDAARAVETQVAGKVPAAVVARVHRVVRVLTEMAPRLDRLGSGSQQAHTVVATATSYLPEAVDGYLRLPREFADHRVVHGGKTPLLILCDQLDLLSVTLSKVSDAVSRQDANALVAHGQFLAEKFTTSSLSLDTPPAASGVRAADGGSPGAPGRLEAP